MNSTLYKRTSNEERSFDIILPFNSLREIEKTFYNELKSAHEFYIKDKVNTTTIPFMVNPLPYRRNIIRNKKFGVLILGGTFGKSAICHEKENHIIIEKLKDSIVLPLFTSTIQLADFIKNNFDELPDELVINLAYPIDQVLIDQSVDGILKRIGKSLMVESLLNKPFGSELEKVLMSQYGKRVKISVANDGLCLLLSGRTSFPSNKLAFGIAGTGVNMGFFLNEESTVILESDRFKLPKISLSQSAKVFDTSFAKQTEGWALYQRFNDLTRDIQGASIDSTSEFETVINNNISPFSKIAQDLLIRSAQLVACQIAGIVNFKACDLIFLMEGGLYRNAHGYKQTIIETVKQLTTYNVDYVEIENSDIIGAGQLII